MSGRYVQGSLSQRLEPHTVFIEYIPPEGKKDCVDSIVLSSLLDGSFIHLGTVMIDSHTAKDLELVRNSLNGRQMGSLMG